MQTGLDAITVSVYSPHDTWWRHQMETFSALLALCAGNSPVSGEFPAQRPVTRSFDVFFDRRQLNGWVNTREAGDLRRYRAHYDVMVMRQIARRQDFARGMLVGFENGINSHRSLEPRMHCDWGNHNLYLDQPITKWWCQPIGGHALYPTDSPTTTKLRPCSNLTHWGRVTHICVIKLTIIGSDNGLVPARRQAIVWTNAGIWLIGLMGTNFSEIRIGILSFLFKKMHLELSSAKMAAILSRGDELKWDLSPPEAAWHLSRQTI